MSKLDAVKDELSTLNKWLLGCFGIIFGIAVWIFENISNPNTTGVSIMIATFILVMFLIVSKSINTKVLKLRKELEDL